MTIERKIKINGRDYFLGIEIKYDKDNYLKKLNGSGFDMGDLSIMIEYFETNYQKDAKEFIYDELTPYMNDILYLYDRFPFVSYIKDILYNDAGHITYIGRIDKDEIDDYIKNNNINMNRWDKKNCRCPLLYE